MCAMKIDELMGELTLEEKASLVSGRDFWKTQDVERLGIPSVMMCDGPNGLRKQEGQGDHLGINESIPTVCYPTASALGSSFDRELLKEQGELLGEECLAEHVGMLLGPGVNMKRSPLCGRNFEYYSEDPYLSGELASAYIAGLQSKGVASCVKHFAANSQETGRMSSSMDVDERTLREIYMPAFETAVKKGKVRSVMCSYNAINGTFSAENKWLLTDVLRKEWGFDGFVVTDWGASKNRAKGLAAGVDLEMPGRPDLNRDWIVERVKSGEIPMEDLDRAVRNVLTFVKQATENQEAYDRLTGRTGKNMPAPVGADGLVNDGFDRKHAMDRSADFAAECAVLLKNEDHVLPLKRSERVAFIGEFAEKPRYQGAGSSHVHVPHPVSALEAAKHAGISVSYARGYDTGDEAAMTGDTKASADLIREAADAARHADKAVIFAGLPESFEMEGADRKHLHMPENQVRLIEAVAAANPDTIVVLHTGSAVELPWLDEARAILLMHLGGGNVGTAAVRLLYGDANPSGKLAETWPIQLEDNPSYLNFPGEDNHTSYREGIYIGYRYYDKKHMKVNFPFGHGLSYTSFAYSDLKLAVEKEAGTGHAVKAADRAAVNAASAEMPAGALAAGQAGAVRLTDKDRLIVTCRVKNTGTMAGKEVAELYVSEPCGEVSHPLRELKGFEKISLQPGEEKTVRFVLDARAFSYYETKIHDFYAQSGTYVISIGSSSRDIRLSGSAELTATRELPLHVTMFSEFRTLKKSAAGRVLLEKLMTQLGMGPDKDDEGDSVLGESMESKRESFYGMPIMALATFGVMGADEVQNLVDRLNEGLSGDPKLNL